MTSPAMRARYLGDAVSTASPGRLLVMLYERLIRDISQAEAALAAGDRTTGSRCLLHAQEIIIELRTTLDLDAWDGAIGLAKLYGFLLTELVAANVHADIDRAAACRTLVEPLLDAWQQAAAEVAATEKSVAVATATAGPARVA